MKEKKIEKIFFDNDHFIKCDDPKLVHNDIADWNQLIENEKLTGIVDWDECYSGDPITDFSAWSVFFPFERMKHLKSGYKKISSLPDDFEEKLHLYRLRYIVSKMTLRTKKLMFEMKLISVNLPESYLKVLEILVVDGKFPNRSEAIRVAIRDLIKTEYIIEESVNRNIAPSIIESEVDNEIQKNLFN